jgi:hypothetical protein
MPTHTSLANGKPGIDVCQRAMSSHKFEIFLGEIDTRGNFCLKAGGGVLR